MPSGNDETLMPVTSCVAEEMVPRAGDGAAAAARWSRCRCRSLPVSASAKVKPAAAAWLALIRLWSAVIV